MGTFRGDHAIFPDYLTRNCMETLRNDFDQITLDVLEVKSSGKEELRTADNKFI